MSSLSHQLTRAVAGLRCSDSPIDRLGYARDLWPRHHISVRGGALPKPRPACVVWPTSTEQVCRLLRYCSDNELPLVPYGAGSGVCGGVTPSGGSVVMDLKGMQRWRRWAPEEGYLDVEAGALGIRLEEELQARGYTVGHFPSSILCSTVGGWVAARGAGQCSGLYGKIEDMVAGLECVDGRGQSSWLLRRQHGPDITPLIIGSEGILGAITAVRLRLHPVAKKRAFGALSLPSMEAGYETIRRIFQRGLRPAVCRLYDPFDSMMAKRSKGERHHSGGKTNIKKKLLAALLRQPRLLNGVVDVSSRHLFGDCKLVLMFEGEDARVDAELQQARALALAAGAEDLGEGPARHWLDHRYSVSYRQAPMFMLGAFVDTMEVASSWQQLGVMYQAVRDALANQVFVMAHMSHAYPDGCSIYFTFAGSAANDHDARERYDETWRLALAAVIASGGTISHHHGVGRSKAPQLASELGLGVEVVRDIKAALDPHHVLNPGNLLPTQRSEQRQVRPPPSAPELDLHSGLVTAAGDCPLRVVARAVSAVGWQLGVDTDIINSNMSVDGWLRVGAPGAADRWLDPVDQWVAGYVAHIPQRGRFEVSTSPRRAAGPDLLNLFVGANGAVGTIETATLRIQRHVAHPLLCNIERNPAVTADERGWIERVYRAAAAGDVAATA
ncbi:MAG TPA: FAD-binding oxidoreductase [Sorangium sp.]|nr:FAD-binding oxidoreductase [Sorangium sp.]